MLTHQFQNAEWDGSRQSYHPLKLHSSIYFEVNGAHHLHKHMIQYWLELE
jgi:hypothetical protein